jgi:hypothetical protein
MRPKFTFLVLGFAAVLLHPIRGWADCGSAYFSDTINWPQNPTLYYSIAGAPANSCGDLYASRNGSAYNLESAGWICTDGSGNATKGPWYWSNQTHDETAYAFIYFPAANCQTPNRKHIWDVNPPTVAITTCGPSSFQGTASDGTWGAGFDSAWASCLAGFYDSTTDRWWVPSTGSYSEPNVNLNYCTCNGMPSLSVTWSCSSKPTSHTPGHNYIWYAWSFDGGQVSSPASCSFTY